MVLVSVYFCDKLLHSSLKQHIFIALEFCRFRVQQDLPWLESKFQQGYITSEALVKNPIFYIRFIFKQFAFLGS